MRKRLYWKKAGACAFALAFLLAACGGAGRTGSSSPAPAEEAYVEEAEEAYVEEEKEAMATSAYKGAQSYGGAHSAGAVDMAMDMDMGEAEAAPAAAKGDGASGAADGEAGEDDLKSPNRKIVYTGNVSLQTLDYEKSAQSIHDKIGSYGGFIENENTTNDDPYWYYADRSSGYAAKRTRRNLDVTARIPAGKFDAFMKDLENDGQVTSTSISANNISVQYANHDASRKALEIERDRLLKMMDKAETVEEMIAVEERLTEVERELGDEKTQLTAMDRDVDFSTVHISLQEVFEYSEPVVEISYGEKLRRAFGRAIEGFVAFWQDIILFVVETFPFLIMLAILIAAVVKLARRGARRRREKRIRLEEERRRRMAAGPDAAESGLSGPLGTDAGASARGGAGRRGFGLFRRHVKEAPGSGAPAGGGTDSGAAAAREPQASHGQDGPSDPPHDTHDQ